MSETQPTIGPGAYLNASAFWEPEFLQSSAWTEHAPFAFWLTGALRPGVLVELGTHGGYSFFSFCQAVTKLQLKCLCYAIDTWKGDEHAGFYGEEVFERVNEYNRKKYAGISRLIRSTFDEARGSFPDGSIDLLHIDGRHFYEDIEHDFNTWTPKLSDRSVVLFHDTNVTDRNFGVYRFWQEIAGQYPSFEFLHGKGLGVLGYGPNLPHEVKDFLRLANQLEMVAEIRAVYARLGAAIRMSRGAIRDGAGASDALNSRAAQDAISRLRAVGAELSRVKATLVHRDKEIEEIVIKRDEASASVAQLTLNFEREKKAHAADRLTLKQVRTELARRKARTAKAQRQIQRLTGELDRIHQSFRWRLLNIFSRGAGTFASTQLAVNRRVDDDPADAGVGVRKPRPASGEAVSPEGPPPDNAAAAPEAASMTEAPFVAADPPSFTTDMPDLQWVRQKDFIPTNEVAAPEFMGILMSTAPAALTENGVNASQIVADPVAFTAFCRMVGVDDRHALRGFSGNVAARPDGLTDWQAHPVPCLEGGAELRVVDAWFANDRELRLRFAAARPFVARFFQYDLSAAGHPIFMVESPLHGTRVDFADVPLTNPLLPVLMTVTTPEGHLRFASLLPFPSLCRGGVHYGELCAVATGTSYFDSLQAVSAALLGEMLGGTAEPDFSVARLEIDLQGANGAERIFSTEVREWLAAIMHLRVIPGNPSSITRARARRHLEESLAVPSVVSRPDIAAQIAKRETGGTLGLALPADSVPSLHALVSRRLGIPGETSCAVGTFVVAETGSSKPEWVAMVPPMGEELLALQPAAAQICYPVLTRLRPEDELAAIEVSSAPLAIRFCATGGQSESRLITPVSRDAPGPLLRRVMNDSATGTISVIVEPCSQPKEFFAAFLESLRFQTLADKVDIVATMDVSQPERRSAAEAALHRFFPGRHVLIEGNGNLGSEGVINLAVGGAPGRFLLISGAGIVLHDPRTLEALRLIADHNRVASASCVLINEMTEKKVRKIVFRSGGIFPSDPSLAGSSNLTFSEPDCSAVFRLATYPVAGNSSALFMVRADVWRELGGFQSSPASISDDIDYGVRALEKGFVHFCTSVISAGLLVTNSRAPNAGVVVPYARQAAPCVHRKVVLSSCILRGLGA